MRITVPSILTTAFRFHTSHFGDSIVELQAKGERNNINIEERNEQYGVTKEEIDGDRIKIDYALKEGRPNPLGDNAIEELIEYIESTLEPFVDSDGKEFPPDVSVSRMVVEIVDEELKDRVEDASTKRFDMVFSSEPAESGSQADNVDARGTTRDVNHEMGVYKQGFEVRNMNLVKVIETAKKYSQDNPDPLYRWRGHKDLSPKPNDSVVGILRRNHFPSGDISRNKHFTSQKGSESFILTGWE